MHDGKNQEEEEWYRPGCIPRERYIHAETSTVYRGVFVWCIYMRSGRMEEGDLPKLDVRGTPRGCRTAVVAGDFNTASTRARNAILDRLRLPDDMQLDEWRFPCTTNKRRSLVQCQLEKIFIDTHVVVKEGGENDDTTEMETDAEAIFSVNMLNSSLMRTGYVNKRGAFVSGGLLGAAPSQQSHGGDNVDKECERGGGGASARHLDKGCKDYILTATHCNSVDERDGADNAAIVVICNNDDTSMAWTRFDGNQQTLPTASHWSDHAAVVRSVGTGNDRERLCIATLNMAADQASPFEWFDADLIPLYALVAKLIEKPICAYNTTGFGDADRYQSLCALLAQDEHRRCADAPVGSSASIAHCPFDPEDGSRSVMELMIMKLASSDKRITQRPCLKNCSTNQTMTDFVRRVVINGNHRSAEEADADAKSWWHEEFFRLWTLPEHEVDVVAMDLSTHVLRLFDFITMTAVAMLGGIDGQHAHCVKKLCTLLSHEPISAEHKANAIKALVNQFNVRCCCLTDITNDMLRVVLEALNQQHETESGDTRDDDAYTIAGYDLNVNGKHGVAILVRS